MPSVERKGKVGKYLEFPEPLAARLQEFAASRGETFTAHVIQAVERHLAYPPPRPEKPTPPPLGDAPRIATAGLSARARKAVARVLRDRKLGGLEDITKVGEEELLECRNVGAGTVQEIREWLASNGLRLLGE